MSALCAIDVQLDEKSEGIRWIFQFDLNLLFLFSFNKLMFYIDLNVRKIFETRKIGE